jgi:hypothetical protein
MAHYARSCGTIAGHMTNTHKITLFLFLFLAPSLGACERLAGRSDNRAGDIGASPDAGPMRPNPCPYYDELDLDCDGVPWIDWSTGQWIDNCMDDFNPDQRNSDHDFPGDLCDKWPLDSGNDFDGDGVSGHVDNCPAHDNPDQADSDSDGFGDPCDQADDGPACSC